MGDMRETQEILLINTDDRKPVSRRRKINWRNLYKRSVRREFRWALLTFGQEGRWYENYHCIMISTAVIMSLKYISARFQMRMISAQVMRK